VAYPSLIVAIRIDTYKRSKTLQPAINTVFEQVAQ
jgi:hypothetical protein